MRNPEVDLLDVFATQRSRLKRAAQDIVGNPACADDLVQDACLKAIESAPAGVQDPLPYALRMVRNMAIDRVRRAAFESRLFTADDDALSVAGASATPEHAAIARQHLRRVAHVLATLPERTRQVFELCRLEGRPQCEIAQRLGVSPAMVHLLLRDIAARCRAACRA